MSKCGRTNSFYYSFNLPSFLCHAADNGCYTGRSDGSINVQAVFDMGGVTGYVQFYQRAPGEPTEINVNLEGLDQFAGSYPWHAHQFPVRDALQKDFPCSLEEIGRHYDPLNVGGSPTYDADCNPGNQSACEVGDFGGKVGRIRNDMVQQFYLDNELDLYEQNSVIGRALVIHYPEPRNDRFICANIEPVGCRVKNLRAAFDNGEFQGDVVIRHTAGKDNAKIFVDVYSTDTAGNGTRSWNLFMGRAGADGSCDGLAGDVSLIILSYPNCSSCCYIIILVLDQTVFFETLCHIDMPHLYKASTLMCPHCIFKPCAYKKAFHNLATVELLASILLVYQHNNSITLLFNRFLVRQVALSSLAAQMKSIDCVELVT